jgi:hypothetical protein
MDLKADNIGIYDTSDSAVRMTTAMHTRSYIFQSLRKPPYTLCLVSINCYGLGGQPSDVSYSC